MCTCKKGGCLQLWQACKLCVHEAVPTVQMCWAEGRKASKVGSWCIMQMVPVDCQHAKDAGPQ
jgi:hypothetical protein